MKLFLLENLDEVAHGGHIDTQKVSAKALCNGRKVFSVSESRRWSIPTDAKLPSADWPV